MKRSTRNLIRMVTAVGLALSISGLVEAEQTDASVTLRDGKAVSLTLLHHLNSKYSVAGSRVYLRVAEDVIENGQVVIARDAPLEGTIDHAYKSQAGGVGGALSFSVATVNAVDGTSVPLELEATVMGRDRTDAAVGMTFAFGLAGLFTKGRMAYVEKGTRYTARTAAEREIDASFRRPVSAEAPEAPQLTASARFKPERVTLRIEKGRRLRPLSLYVEAPEGHGVDFIEPKSLRVVQIGDVVLPEPVKPLTIMPLNGNANGGQPMVVYFDAWKIVSFCKAGEETVRLEGTLKDSTPFSSVATAKMVIKKKATGA